MSSQRDSSSPRPTSCQPNTGTNYWGESARGSWAQVVKNTKKCGGGSTASACCILCQSLPGDKPQPQLVTLCSSSTRLPWLGGSFLSLFTGTWTFPFFYIYKIEQGGGFLSFMFLKQKGVSPSVYSIMV